MSTPSSGRDRRVHLRLSPEELNAPATIRIPSRPPVSLIDLSSGGALIEFPFQITPEARLTVELTTGPDQLKVPFRLLRCYVASLKGGVRYQAAGTFEADLNLPLMRAPAQTPATRLVSTLEAFLRQNGAGDRHERVREFDHLLVSLLDGVRRGEPSERISSAIRARLEMFIPSLTIEPAATAFLHDPSRSARFFGIDFKSKRVLTTIDRRILRVAAQLLTAINESAPKATRAVRPSTAPADIVAPTVTHGVADWQEMCRTAAPLELSYV